MIPFQADVIDGSRHTQTTTQEEKGEMHRGYSLYPPYIQWLLLLSLCASLVTHDTQ